MPQHTAQITQLLERLSALVEALQLIDHRVDPDASPSVLKTIVNRCVAIARLGTTRSVEEHLKFLKIPNPITESSAIRQIDKLARYIFTCKDLARLARNSDYHTLFSRVDITYLDSFPRMNRPGCAQRCFVHAEVQQILHMEKQPHRPAPRAIGCSKLACYLCDLLIRKQGRYVVSHTHGRLYEKWTIPDVDWMTTTQAVMFRCIVQAMIQDIRKAIQKFRDEQGNKRRKSWAPYPLESRACLPLSSNSTLSLTKRPIGIRNEEGALQAERTNNFEAIAPQLRRHSWPVILPPFVRVTEVDLPWSRYARVGQGPLNIQIDWLSLHIEFSSATIGLLSISFHQATRLDEIKIIDAWDVPTGSEMAVQGSRASRKTRFCVRFGSARIIQIEFTWEGVTPV